MQHLFSYETYELFFVERTKFIEIPSVQRKTKDRELKKNSSFKQKNDKNLKIDLNFLEFLDLLEFLDFLEFLKFLKS